MEAVNILNVPDYKKPDGTWGKYYTQYREDGVRLQNHTRASVLWNNLQSRCRTGSAQQRNNVCYTICENRFENYDKFTDWCQDQYGYMNKNPSGTFWSLDKDVLLHGNRVYSPDTCLFIPQHVNNVLVGSDKTRGDFPIGVSEHIQGSCVRYMAGCRKRDGSNYLGVYLTAIEAHRAWQEAKIERILEEAEDHRQHTKLFDALLRHAERIQDDLYNNRETKVKIDVEYPNKSLTC